MSRTKLVLISCALIFGGDIANAVETAATATTHLTCTIPTRDILSFGSLDTGQATVQVRDPKTYALSFTEEPSSVLLGEGFTCAGSTRTGTVTTSFVFGHCESDHLSTDVSIDRKGATINFIQKQKVEGAERWEMGKGTCLKATLIV
jgi:hypothetical protein